MRNPLLTDGQKLQPLSQWKRELRGYTFEKNDVNYNVLNCRLEVKFQLFNIDTMPRKDYMRDYMRDYMKQKRFKPTPGLRVSELAQIKFCNKKTVLNNLNSFDLIPKYSPLSIKFNDKIWNWNPKLR